MNHAPETQVGCSKMLSGNYLLLMSTKFLYTIKYSLLNSWKQLHVIRMLCCRTDRNTHCVLASCRQMLLISLSCQNGHITHLIWTVWVI